MLREKSTPEIPPTIISPTSIPIAAAPEEPPKTATQLQGEYFAAKEYQDRVEVVYQLGELDTTDSIMTLVRLFQAETDVDLRQEMLDTIDRGDEQVPAKLAFLAVALRPEQTADIRDAAVGILLTINHRQAIPTWQTLLADPDPERREMAKEQIEDLQQLDAN